MKKNITVVLLMLISALALTSCSTVSEGGTVMTVLDKSVTREGFEPISEDDFKEEMDDLVMPSLEKIMKNGTFSSNRDGHRIYYEKFDVENEKGSVVIMHGFTEYIKKYSEVIWYFVKEGYDVYMPEHFGHGWSERSSLNLSKVRVDEFDTYVDDAFQFVTDVVNKERDRNEPLILFGHSMGGGISARMLEKYPGHFDAAILSSPMMAIETGVPEFIVRFFSANAKFFGAGENYIFGHYDYTDEDLFNDPSSVATSYNRYRYWLDQRTEDEWKQMYGATWDWIDAAMEGTGMIRKEAEARKVTIPVLLFQADNDTLVKSSGHFEFAASAKNVEIVFCPDTRHEIMNSPNDTVNAYWVTIFDFLDKVTV